MNILEINSQSDMSAWEFDAIFILSDQNPAVYVRLQVVVNWVGALPVTSKPPKANLGSTWTARFSQEWVSAQNP